jgi:DNA polymerase IV
MEREIIYMTVANFPVAVERVIHPELRGRPVVVAPRGAARSIVTALSSEARAAGIRPGMALARAVRYCRDMVVLPPNEPLYLRASRAIFRVLEDFSPLLEPSGHGHAYLDITGTGRLFGPPRDTAWKAQKEIRSRLRLEASLGIASNKLVSRIASEVIQPAGLQDVPHGNEPSFLSPLPVRLLPGVGPQTEAQLADLNLRVIHDIAAMRMEHLALAFGRLGFGLYQHARGIDRTPVYPMRAVPAVEEARVLPEDSNDCEALKRVLREICERAVRQLREKKQRAGRMELCLRFADYREESRKLKLAPPLQSSTILYACALPVLNLVLERRTRVRSLHLTLTDLSAGSVQMELFADPVPERNVKLELALDTLRRRYGEKAVGGSTPLTPGSRQ